MPGLASQKYDRAVYGRESDLSDEEILEKLLSLDLEMSNHD